MRSLVFYFVIVLCISVACQKKDNNPEPIPDKTPPVVTQTYPADSSTDVSTDSLIIATFNEEMAPLSINELSFLLESTADSVKGLVNYEKRKAVFTPEYPLYYRTNYKATLTTQISDKAGNSPKLDYSWSFTTAASKDVTNPALVRVYPQDNSTDVPFDTEIRAIFDEPMLPSSMTANTTTTDCDGSVQVSLDDFATCEIMMGQPQHDLERMVFTVKPQNPLLTDRQYKIKVTTSAIDLSGNSLLEDYVSANGFRTLDEISPRIIRVYPLEGSLGNTVSANLSIRFSEVVDLTSLAANYTDTICDGPFQLSLNQFQSCIPISDPVLIKSKNLVIFIPIDKLVESTPYQVRISTQITDLSGNHLDVLKQWSFTTSSLAYLQNNDPLFFDQWHLENSGQHSFAENTGIAGKDVRLSSGILDGYAGRQVLIGVIDTGLEILHEDLAENLVVGGSHDFTVEPPMPEDTDPTNPDSAGDHGTSVAGLIAARGFNGIGVRGAAPFARIKGFNYLANPLVENLIASLGGTTLAPDSSDVDIFNLSIGTFNNDEFQIDPLVEDQLIYGVENLRDGRGAIYVKAAGNGFLNFGSIGNEADCSLANQINLSCQNTNMDPMNSVPWTIVTGALNANGTKASYSTAGSAIWVSAPGGEGGYSTPSNWGAVAGYYFDPALVTLDQSGCDQGYSQYIVSGYAKNLFEDNANNSNPNCSYTSTFAGTSAAAPVLSGLIALMLEANPELSWRDVKHILATTADVDPIMSISDNSVIINGTYVAEMPWTVNKAGFWFHNWYGFGSVNADAAILAAKNYSTDLGKFIVSEWIDSGTVSNMIQDDFTGTFHKIRFNKDISIEAVQVKLNIIHPSSGDLGIELFSPSGTRSILLNVRNGFAGTADLIDMVLLSNAFYGESSIGEWKLKISDGQVGGGSGTLESWSIRILGH
ncbi:MAG: Ig-like domain-containing protein [Deltaproteobacteria bacterium]|nr:Ig-like domain-containing protein [Deltaproteobacteria bacterium]